MSKRIAVQIEELFLSVLDEKYELVDVEYVKEGAFYYLRVFVDKDGGLDIDEISDITRVLNKLLDEKDPIQQQYFLEVSTPGLGRALKKERDFIRGWNREYSHSIGRWTTLFIKKRYCINKVKGRLLVIY